MSVRVKKVGSLIKEELSILFQRNFPISEYGFITITEVLMSPDLRVAKVYISIFGDAEKKKKSFALLQAQKPSIRTMLGHVIHLRYTPELIFYLDESIEHAMKIETIFQKIHKQDEQNKEQNMADDV